MKNKIKFTAPSIYCGGRHFQVLCQIFSLPQIPKAVQLSTGKIQLNAELTFKPNIERIELLYRMSMPSASL